MPITLGANETGPPRGKKRLETLLEGEAPRPSGRRNQTCRIAVLDGNVGRACVGFRNDVNRDAGAGDQHSQDLGDARWCAAAHVVGLAGSPVLCDENIRADGIADVYEISLRLKVSDGDWPALQFCLSRCDLRCKSSADE